MSLSAGDRLGPYEIVGLLGAGGMGAVYRARDPRLDRDVAIKVLHADALSDAEHRQRFVREAKVASALRHPNIVTVYDIGTEGDVVYLVMEMVEGESLDQLIPPTGFRISEVLRIGAQIADAFATAHAAGIVHRDLKPANVMVQPDGRVTILDFGLAKLFHTAGADDMATRALAGFTIAGTLIGTPAYMSPEQAEGKPLDGRSDIFSFGALLYELCTGRRAFNGESHASIMASVLQHDPQPPSDARPGLPSELSRLVMRCLRKDRARRAQSMADLQVALQELKEETDSGRLTPQSTAVVPAVARRRQVRALAVLGSAVLVVAAVFGWRTLTLSRPPAPVAALQPVPFTSYPGNETDPAFAPDGNQIAFTWDGEQEDNSDIYVKLIGPGTPLRLTTDPRPDVRPAWSPDGRSISFLRGLDRDTFAVMLVPALGGAERRLGQLVTRNRVGGGSLERSLAGICWSPDSRYLFVTGSDSPGANNRLLRISVDTGEVKTIAALENGDGYTLPSLSPDGRTLAIVRVQTGRTLELLTLSDAYDRAGSRILSSVGSNIEAAQWTTDSNALVFSVAVSNPLPLYRVLAAGGAPEPLAWTGQGAVNLAVASQGRRMAFERAIRDTNIWRVSLERSAAANHHAAPLALLASSFREVFPQYSPDGRRLAFYSNRGGSVQIWTSDANGSRAVPLTSMALQATTGTPRWSPDGQRIAFDSNASGSYHIYVINADGGQPRALTTDDSRNFNAAWSPDGRWIYFASTRTGEEQVWRMPAEGGNAEQITRRGGHAPAFSPEGEWLYFTKGEGRDGLWRMPTGGGVEQRVLENVYRYDYAVTRKGVYFVPLPKPDGTSSVQFLDGASGTITRIVNVDKPVDVGLAVSPDERELLFAQTDYAGRDLMLVENFD